MLHQHKDYLRSFYCTDSKVSLDAGMDTCCLLLSLICLHCNSCFVVIHIHTYLSHELRSMLTVKYSSVGSTANKETDTFIMFMDYLYSCQKGKCNYVYLSVYI